MENLYYLSDLKAGDMALIEKVEVEDYALRKRMAELGFVKGLKVDVLKANKRLMLVGVLSSSFCIDKELASKIVVYKRVK